MQLFVFALVNKRVEWSIINGFNCRPNFPLMCMLLLCLCMLSKNT